MDPTQFIKALCEDKTLVDHKHNHFIYLSKILTEEGFGDQTNFITAAVIAKFESDAYAITPGGTKVDIFCRNKKMMTVDPEDFEVNA